MRNGVFLGAVAFALVGGGLIGWFGDFSALAGIRGPAAPPAARAPADPFAPRVDGLKFRINMSHNTPGHQPTQPTGYIPMGERGYEPNGCTLPRATEGAKIMLVSLYSGDAVSTVALGSQDEETGVIEVVIEPGTDPLYVVLSNFRPTIWRFSGAVERVERAVMVASKGDRSRVIRHPGDEHGPAIGTLRAGGAARRAAESAPRRMSRPTRAYAGVIGLKPDRISTSEDIRCFDYFSEAESLKAEQAAKVVRRAFGRAPDVIAGYYSLAAVSLPSAQGARGEGRLRPPEGFEPAMWREAVRFNPWGISPVRRESIISAVDVTSYDVLPNQTGLAQLIGSGHIRRVRGDLEVVQPIPRLPAAMGGAHMTTLTLAEGVPLPAGDPVHSCIRRREADGRETVLAGCAL